MMSLQTWFANATEVATIYDVANDAVQDTVQYKSKNSTISSIFPCREKVDFMQLTYSHLFIDGSMSIKSFI